MGDHPVAPDGVVRPVAGGAAVGGDHVGAVEGVVQAAPAGVGGVQGIAGVVHRHHQLRSGHPGDLRVHTGRQHLDRPRLRRQVADRSQERLVLAGVVGPAAPVGVPPVDPCLQVVPGRQQGPRARLQVGEGGLQARPEPIGVDPGSGGEFGADELLESGRDLETSNGHVVVSCHALTLGGRSSRSESRRGQRLSRVPPRRTNRACPSGRRTMA